MSAGLTGSLLFLSCDIVGSTHYKQQPGVRWRETFLSFYREFPQILGDLAREAPSSPAFQLWKPIGDELIFTCPVRHEEDVLNGVRIWLDAMRAYEVGVLNDVSLATKGGAFIATFPGPDSESSIPRDPLIETSDKGVVELNSEALTSRSTDYLFDYFGPSIDTGFRVMSVCSQRYFTLSLEVAWAMATCRAEAGADAAKHPIDDMLLLDSPVFKGVWGGREYPLFALDREHTDLVNVAMAKIRGHDLEAHHVVSLCRECSAKPDWPSRLYLPGSGHQEFATPPEDSLAQLRSNSMDGAESVPQETDGVDLDDDAPLGQPAGEVLVRPEGDDQGKAAKR